MSKFETNPNIEIRNPDPFRISDFEFVSDFDIRISDFEALPLSRPSTRMLEGHL